MPRAVDVYLGAVVDVKSLLPWEYAPRSVHVPHVEERHIAKIEVHRFCPGVRFADVDV